MQIFRCSCFEKYATYKVELIADGTSVLFENWLL